MFDINPDIVIFLIPIIAILGGFTVAIVGIIMEAKKEELRRKERIIAMEKGIPLPPERAENKGSGRPRHIAARRTGLVLTFLGIALVVAISLSSGGGLRSGVWGFVVLALGLAFLVASIFEKRDYDSMNKQ